MPLAPSNVELELKGVPTAVVNALRRVLLDEMRGHCLQVADGGFDSEETTEVFMLPQMLRERIAGMPLWARVPAETAAALRLRLDVTNTSAVVRQVNSGDFAVVGGKMPAPLFNPTFPIAILQPGRRLVVDKVQVAAGQGRNNAAFMVARCGAYRHLDLDQHPREATHLPGGTAVDLSGYRVSSMQANPQWHVLSFVLPATTKNKREAHLTIADACTNIVDRLRFITARVEGTAAPAAAAKPSGRAAGATAAAAASLGAQYSVVALGEGLNEGILHVPGETYTIGELLRRAVFDLYPGVSNVAYEIVSHESSLNFTVRHTEDVSQMLLRALRHSVATFEAIQAQVLRA